MLFQQRIKQQNMGGSHAFCIKKKLGSLKWFPWLLWTLSHKVSQCWNGLVHLRGFFSFSLFSIRFLIKFSLLQHCIFFFFFSIQISIYIFIFGSQYLIFALRPADVESHHPLRSVLQPCFCVAVRGAELHEGFPFKALGKPGDFFHVMYLFGSLAKTFKSLPYALFL